MLSEKIKKLRKERKITQQDLGKVIGVSTSMIGMYETNARKPSYEVLTKMAQYFNVSTDYLLDKTDSKNIDSKNDTDKNDKSQCELTKITDIKEAMDLILSQPGLMLNGEILSNESKIALANAIKMGLAYAEQKQKEDK